MADKKEKTGLDGWQAMVAGVWNQFLPNKVLHPNANFFECGGKSLVLIRVLQEIEQRFGAKLSLTDFLKEPTLKNMTHLALTAKPGNQRPLMRFKANPTADQLLLLPGIFGLGLTFRLLNLELKGNFDVMTFQFCHELPEVLSGIGSLSKKIVDDLAEFNNGRKIHIAGFSIGGLILVGVLEELKKRGFDVGVAIILDSEPPFSPSQSYKLVDPILANAKESELSNSIESRSRETMRALTVLRDTWKPNFKFDGPAYLLRSSIESTERQVAQESEWKELFPKLKSYEIEAGHINFLNFPYVNDVAKKVDQIIAEASSINSEKAKFSA